MKLRYWTYDLPFKYPFTISKGTKTHQPTFVVELEFFGTKGYGEAPAISYYNISVEKMVADLEQKKKLVEKFAFTEPSRYWHYLHHLFPENPFLVCALDIAAWDLYGKLQNKPLYKIWKTDYTGSILTDYTIGIDRVEKMIEKLKAMPWPIYKIKMGMENDIEILNMLRRNTNAVFRVDVNAAWSFDEAKVKIRELEKMGVQLIEQPLAKEDWPGMKSLFKESSLPLIADESCVSESDLVKCAGYFHGINIKLTKCSGITPALRMIEQARLMNMKVMMGSMNETTIGSAAIAHFLPQLDYVDMDGPLLLQEDIATGLSYDYGKVILSDEPGLGITFCEPINPS
jgi:L-alanine-DL-glutamate epimerase-like enolase superfamily enzyme